MHTLTECMICGETERTIVCEYNRLIFIEDMLHNDLSRYDYALCHGCGIVYATRRPKDEEYDFIYENFNEFLLRDPNPESLNAAELSPLLKQAIDRDFLPWQELDPQAEGKSRIRTILNRQLELTRSYLPYLEPHIDLEGKKLLHIRAKSSTLADYLRVQHGASSGHLITLFPAHKYLAEKNAGIQAECVLDYENFRIPFDVKYDLIVENHIFIHMLDADQTFATFLSHLQDDGCLFLENELADNRLFEKKKNLFAELRPFHFQHFDLATVKRMLGRYGFRSLSVCNEPEENGSVLLGLARREGEPVPCERIGEQELRQRLDMYRQWRDESILSLPKSVSEALYADELGAIWERVQASGRLTPDPKGKVAALRWFREANVPVEDLEIGRAVEARKRTGPRPKTDKGQPANKPKPPLQAGLRWLKTKVTGASGTKHS